MKLNGGLFQVKKGERVTIQVIPSVNTGMQSVLVLDGDESKNPFDFKVTKNVGQQHSVDCFFGFIGETPPNSSPQFTIKINGDAADNEGPFRRIVRKSSPNHDPSFKFRVV